MEKAIKILNVGRMSYLKALELQNHLANNHKISDDADVLILVEHQPVYTVGLRTKNYTLQDEIKLKNTGAEYYKTNRGGLITFHGPGQLVVYPILNLKNYKPSMKWYICHIEKSVIDMCKKFKLEANTSPHTGVWIGDNKLCAIGVHGSRYITTHGLAINCCVDFKWYDHIVPCGIEDKGVTSLSKELDRNVNISEVIPVFLDSFKSYFSCRYDEYPKEKIKHFISWIFCFIYMTDCMVKRASMHQLQICD